MNRAMFWNHSWRAQCHLDEKVFTFAKYFESIKEIESQQAYYNLMNDLVDHHWTLKRLNNLWTFHFYIFLHYIVVFNKFSIILAMHANLPNVWCFIICFSPSLCDCWTAWNMGGGFYKGGSFCCIICLRWR